MPLDSRSSVSIIVNDEYPDSGGLNSGHLLCPNRSMANGKSDDRGGYRVACQRRNKADESELLYGPDFHMALTSAD